MSRPRRSANPPGRSRPQLIATVSRDVDVAVRQRAADHDVPIAHVVEDLLRSALGLAPLVAPGPVAA